MPRFLPALLSCALAWLAACTCGSDSAEDKMVEARKGKPNKPRLRMSGPTQRAKKAEVQHYGAPFLLKKSRDLSAVLEEGPDPSVPVKVRGRVESVCQRRGCWFILQDRGLQARVVIKDHAFSIPGTAVGRVAIAEGSLEEKTYSQEQARHLEEDRGGDPNAIIGTRSEYVLTATAVRIKPKASGVKKKKKKKKGKKKKGKKAKKGQAKGQGATFQ